MSIFIISMVFSISSFIYSQNTNPVAVASCEEIEYKTFKVSSDNDDFCMLWGYINMKGDVVLDIKSEDEDVKIYAWWTKGQFLIQSEIIELKANQENILTFPPERSARINVKVMNGSAEIRLSEKSKK